MSEEATNKQCTVPSPEQLVLAATAISLAITNGRNDKEVETVLNLLTLVKENTQRILSQRLICESDEVNIDVSL